jgi:hypothetical protein
MLFFCHRQKSSLAVRAFWKKEPAGPARLYPKQPSGFANGGLERAGAGSLRMQSICVKVERHETAPHMPLVAQAEALCHSRHFKPLKMTQDIHGECQTLP